MKIRFGSVCSGIEAASIAWEPLGWEADWFSEVDSFPSAVLRHHWPQVENLGDMTALPEMVTMGLVSAPDVIVGGTPCQAFSVAGRRESLGDVRGQLTLSYIELANAVDKERERNGDHPCIVVWENVPGVLNTKDNAFGCFIAGLAGEVTPLEPAGGKWTHAGYVRGPKRTIAWRVLDAQYFGVAQRRRRVFVVASARTDFDPAAVLFESEGVRRDTAPSRETRQDVTHATTPCLTRSGRGVERVGDTRGQDPVVAVPAEGCFWDGGQLCQTLDAVLHKGQTMPEKNRFPAVLQPVSVTGDITHTLNTANNGKGCSEDGTGRGVPTIATSVALRGREGGGTAELGGNLANTLRASSGGGDKPHVLTVHGTQDPCVNYDFSHTLGRNNGQENAVCFVQNSRSEVRKVGGDGQITGALAAAPGVQQQHYIAQPAPAGVTIHGTDKTARVMSFTDLAGSLRTKPPGSIENSSTAAVYQGLAVRRLTPVECERLQGFPDNHTNVPYRNKPAADGPRYKAIGNSMAVPVMHWIGARIQLELEGSTV